MIVVFLALHAAALQGNPQDEFVRGHLLKEPARNIRTYAPDWSAPLGQRVRPVPDDLLRYFQILDRLDAYESYEPTPAERVLLTEYLALLPLPLQQMMRDRLAGIYFIKHLKASGWTGIALDPDDASKLYYCLVINPESLQQDLSAWMTKKETGAFLPDDSGLHVQINAGTQYRGLLYVLLHEGAHMLDCARLVTPFLAADVRDLYQLDEQPTTYTQAIWRDYAHPLPAFDYPKRAQIRFYGLGGGTKVKLSDAPAIYRTLQHGPFVSIYASTNWADDFADLFTYTYLTHKLGQPYELTIKQGETFVFRYSPIEGEGVRARLPVLNGLLDSR
ncbi:MAG: putative secreted protein [Verrucomicrobia bacterium]|nr:putative secreted protein [Verrucomicrobiota bacterium]